MGFFKNRLVAGLTRELTGLLPYLEQEGAAYVRTAPIDGIVVIQPKSFVEAYDRLSYLYLRLFDLIYGEDPGAEHPPLETPERVEVLENANQALERWRKWRRLGRQP